MAIMNSIKRNPTSHAKAFTVNISTEKNFARIRSSATTVLFQTLAPVYLHAEDSGEAC